MVGIHLRQGESFPHDPVRRGYAVTYREDQSNYCPGCGRSHWYIGRLLAECGFCATAIPLSSAHLLGGSHSRNRKRFRPSMV